MLSGMIMYKLEQLVYTGIVQSKWKETHFTPILLRSKNRPSKLPTNIIDVNTMLNDVEIDF